MTLIACPIFIDDAADVDDAIGRARAALGQGARIIEWRVDRLAGEPDATGVVARLVGASPGPCIVTCRPAWEGGQYDGDETTRAAVLDAAASAGARYVDVELAALARGPAMQRVLAGVSARRGARGIDGAIAGGTDGGTAGGTDGGADGGIILSCHDFERRPADLLQRVEAIRGEPACAVAKIVWTARSLRDNLEAFDLIAARVRPMIVLCMGPFGLLSRVLAPKFGAFLTFATSTADGQSAPGQPTINALRERYRFDAITAATRVYGVIGWPVGHSMSPAVHNVGFAAVGHDGVYLPMPIPPEYEHFKATVGSLVDHPRLDFAGASVTIPHKENLLRFVEERGGRVAPEVARIGAANTLAIDRDGTLACANTDCPAAAAALRRALGDVAGRRVAVLGAGGVARAVVAGTRDAGASVTVFGRTASRAGTLAASFDGVEARSLRDVARERFDVIVNCTPVGMTGGPDPAGSPLPDGVALDEDVTVFDTVYSPARTPLLREAEARGARTVTGEDMFIEQARLQFERWTGVAAPVEVMRRALSVEP